VWGQTSREHAFNFDTPYSFGNPNISLSFGPTSTVPSAVLINLAHGAPASFTYAFNRAYAITAAGGGAFSATLRLHYQDGEVSGLEAGAQLWRYNGSVWTQQGKSASDTTTNWVEQSGVSAFSPWAISSQTPTAITLRAFEAASTNRVLAPFAPIGLAVLLLVLIGAAIRIRRRRTMSLRS
jgi:hypothetical protein